MPKAEISAPNPQAVSTIVCHHSLQRMEIARALGEKVREDSLLGSVRQFIVFGSSVRAEARSDSDLDVAYIDNSRFAELMLAVRRRICSHGERLGLRVKYSGVKDDQAPFISSPEAISLDLQAMGNEVGMKKRRETGDKFVRNLDREGIVLFQR